MSPRRRKRWLAATLLALATTALYAPTADFNFIDFDDHKYVLENPEIQRGLDLESVRWALTSFYFSNWHPLTWLSYLLDYELHGLDPGGFHTTNAMLHVISSIVLLLLLESATGRLGPSAMVALLFALHPLHVESVAWVAERKDVLSTCLGLLSMAAYASYARGGKHGLRHRGPSVLRAPGRRGRPSRDPPNRGPDRGAWRDRAIRRPDALEEVVLACIE